MKLRVLLLCSSLVPGACALDNGVGLLPVMGWGTWNLFGCWGYNWTEVDVKQVTMCSQINKYQLPHPTRRTVPLAGGRCAIVIGCHASIPA